tara:strand:- start:520 stop:708 length:189 start_codon:yes stop_codon:yes gene_type:complete
MYEQGEQFRFGIGLDAKYGAGTAEELEFLAKLPIKLTRVDYEEKITYYKNAVNNFKKEKGLD